MLNIRRPKLLLATLTMVGLSATLATPPDAHACTPRVDSKAYAFPVAGEVVPPDVALHVTTLVGAFDELFLADADGNDIPLVEPEYPAWLGHYADDIDLFRIEPETPLSPGRYTISYTPRFDRPKTPISFEVSADAPYPSPPTVANLDDVVWKTRIFETQQEPRYSCSGRFRQQSLVTFPAPQRAIADRTLLYRVDFESQGDFDGVIDETSHPDNHSSFFVADAPLADVPLHYPHGFVEDGTVTLKAETDFQVECVEITALDLTGREGESFRTCFPQQCAPPPPEGEHVYSIDTVDWTNQPDCSEVYCAALGSCDELPAEDAGPGSPDAGDAGAPSPDAAEQADAAQPDTGGSDASTADIGTQDADASAAGPGGTDDGGCSGCDQGADGSPSPGALALWVVLAGAVGWRRLA